MTQHIHIKLQQADFNLEGTISDKMLREESA